MNRTIKEATVKRYHYDSHGYLLSRPLEVPDALPLVARDRRAA